MEFKTYFKYRNLYMGAAIILLVVLHGRGYIPEGPLNRFAALCYGSVDFFLFCSGIGCFFSYTRDRDPVAFLKRRVVRVFPVYVVFMAYWLYRSPSIALWDALGNLLGVQWLTGREPVFNWYLSAMLVTYLLTPVLATLAERTDTPLKTAGALLLCLVFTIPFLHTDQWAIITTRAPQFFLGMLLAAESRRRPQMTRPQMLLMLLMLLAGGFFLHVVHADGSEELLWNGGMYWYPFLLITPGACLLMALAARALERCAPGRWLVTGVGFLGGYTFEVFLTHCYALGPGPLHYVFFTAVDSAALHLASLGVRKAAAWVGRLFRSRAKAV